MGLRMTFLDMASEYMRQVWALWQTTKLLYIVALPFKLINDASQFVGPTFLNLLLGVVASGAPATLGYFYATLMLLLSIGGSLCDAQHFQHVMRAGVAAPSLSPPSFDHIKLRITETQMERLNLSCEMRSTTVYYVGLWAEPVLPLLA